MMFRTIGMAEMQNFTSGTWLDYARLMLVLGGILILAFLTVRFWLPRIARLKALSAGPIKVVAQFSLEARKTLYVIKAGNAMLLLATSEAGVQFMTALDPDDFVEAQDDAESKELNNRTFPNLLRSLKNRKMQ